MPFQHSNFRIDLLNINKLFPKKFQNVFILKLFAFFSPFVSWTKIEVSAKTTTKTTVLHKRQQFHDQHNIRFMLFTAIKFRLNQVLISIECSRLHLCERRKWYLDESSSNAVISYFCWTSLNHLCVHLSAYIEHVVSFIDLLDTNSHSKPHKNSF